MYSCAHHSAVKNCEQSKLRLFILIQFYSWDHVKNLSLAISPPLIQCQDIMLEELPLLSSRAMARIVLFADMSSVVFPSSTTVWG